jgi:hypothetical protein
MSINLGFHIAMGTVGLLSGALAMAVRKGSRLHRAAGNVFFVSMLATAASAVYAGIEKPYRPAIGEGVLAFYWIASGWLTAKRKDAQLGRAEYGILLLALATVAVNVILGVQARNSPNGLLDGIPAAFYFFFAGIAALGAVFDVRMIIRRGLSGARRIARHLLRMSAGLTLAAANLFIGNSQVFPAALRDANVLFVPVMLALGLLIFWFIRVRFTGWYRAERTIGSGATNRGLEY